jgi:two-component system KDP operon response regulator KdpE
MQKRAHYSTGIHRAYRSRTSARSRIKMKKVLIVEDNADCRELLNIMIGRLGYEIVLARTGEEGVYQANVTHPDLILMDFGLPDMTGDQAMEQIKKDPTMKDIPVVVQTAYGTAPVKPAIDAGAAEVLHKPLRLVYSP